MLSHLDTQIGTLVDELKEKGLWDNTLFAMFSDNGGAIYLNATRAGMKPYDAGGNNYPLRGGKLGNAEGGVRVNSFVSGGYVPEGQRGKTLEGYMATEDWYATFCAVAGISSFDERANETGQPPIDAINLWPYISGETMESPREEVYGNSATEFPGITAGAPFVQYLTDKDGYKLIIGSLVDAVRTGPVYPNASSSWTELDPQYIESCSSQDTPPDGVPAFEEGVGYAGACLFNVFEDPFELNRLDTRTPENAAIALRLSERMVALTKTAVPEENEAPLSNFACHTMNSFWEGWLGPWIPLVLPSKGATQPAGGTTRVGFSIGLSLVVYLIGSLTLTF